MPLQFPKLVCIARLVVIHVEKAFFRLSDKPLERFQERAFVAKMYFNFVLLHQLISITLNIINKKKEGNTKALTKQTLNKLKSS